MDSEPCVRHASEDTAIFLSIPTPPPTLVTWGLGTDPSAHTRLWPSDGEGSGGLPGGLDALKVRAHPV